MSSVGFTPVSSGFVSSGDAQQTGYHPPGNQSSSGLGHAPDSFASGFQPPTTPLPQVPKKRLIVCCDGTWQSANHGVQSTPSNIAKISRSIAKYTREKDGSIIHQIVWYDAGVATSTDSVKTFVANFMAQFEGTWGEGLDENVCEAYSFLVNNYNPGDELYFFGFSRGAYTARAAAGLAATVGIATNEVMDDFYKMYQAYKVKKRTDDIKTTAWGKSEEGQYWLGRCRKPDIQAVGVFDTVGGLGWPENTHFDVTKANQPFAFHNTDIHPEIKNAFQALALDEHRAAFPPCVWSLPEGSQTNLIQCWFPGIHRNIGGGLEDFQKDIEQRRADFEAMANITFCWMTDRIAQYTPLGFDDTNMMQIIERYAKNIVDMVEAEATNQGYKHTQLYRGWGIGPLVDSYTFSQSFAGSVTRTPAEYNKDTHSTTHEYIHPVVAFDWTNGYRPASMAGFTRDKISDGKGYVWHKTYTPQSDQGFVSKVWSYFGGKSVPAKKNEIHLEIPEFVIPYERCPNGEFECDWGKCMERYLIRADTRRYWGDERSGEAQRKNVIQNTIDFVKKLDVDNGFPAPLLQMYDPTVFSKVPAGFTVVAADVKKKDVVKKK